MAEQIESDTSGSLLMQGIFEIKGTKYEISTSSKDISWKKSGGKEGGETTIPIIDIVSVKAAASKSAKPGENDSWILCYAERRKKNLLKKASVIFIGEPTECVEWTNRIQQELDSLSQRPRKILALINPISGWSKGEKQYISTVAPLFADANLVTDVKVTERANHSAEILEAYDLSNIDCLVIVGGDGMYSEVASALMNRKLKETTINVNNPDVDLPYIDTPIGIIPGGTGNVIAGRMYGCKDIETAALSIIIGKRNVASIGTLSCCGEFANFSVQSLGTGIWSNLVYKAENNRNLGVFRFPLLMISELFMRSPRPITYNIQYKKNMSDNKPQTQEIQEGSSEERDVKESVDVSEWKTVERDYIGIMVFDADAIALSECNTLLGESLLFCLRPCTRGQMMSFLGCMIKKDFTTPMDFVEKIVTSEFKIKVVKPSDRASHNGLIERIVAIDGEPIEFKEPEFHVRTFLERLQLFANVPADYWISKDPVPDKNS